MITKMFEFYEPRLEAEMRLLLTEDPDGQVINLLPLQQQGPSRGYATASVEETRLPFWNTLRSMKFYNKGRCIKLREAAAS